MRSREKTVLVIISICVFLLLSVFAGVLLGSTGSLFAVDVSSLELINIRLPRVIAALMTGGALSICGVALQAILGNPLAEPFLLGVSGGAVLGGTIGIIFGTYLFDSVFGVRVFSFGGALGSIFLLLYINGKQGGFSPINMLLTGVIFNGFVSAVVTIFKAFIPAIKLQKVTLWLSGYIPYFNIQDIAVESLVVMIFSLLIVVESGRLNLLSLGDEVTQTSGVDVNALRIRIFIYTSVITGLVVSMSGLIGFIGLIIPQGLRSLGLINNRYLLPLSFVAGGAFTIFADLMCRLISGMYGFEPPISAVTAIIGGPIFIFLLKEYFRGRGETI